MDFKKWAKSGILILIPHSSKELPKEISSFADPIIWKKTSKNIENHTDKLYNFTNLINNKQIIFPYNRYYIDVNRHPDVLNDSVPVNFGKESLYKNIPNIEKRKELIKKYHNSFHEFIEKTDKEFILDGHAMRSGQPDEYGIDNKGDIFLFNWQNPLGTELSAPDVIIETYAKELKKLLPELKIVINPKKFQYTYGHSMAKHGLNGTGKNSVPFILQETDEKLYLGKSPKTLNKLQRAFAEALTISTKK